MVRRQAMQVRRQPLGGDQRFARVGQVRTLPPPVGGWNRKDSLQNMPVQDAVQLQNWFPRQSDCVTRPGYSQFCATGETGAVDQLVVHDIGSSPKMLACTSGKIFDITTGTASSLGTGYSNSYWSYDNISNITFLANGQDTLKTYNGTTLSDATYTGPTLTSLSHAHTFKSRIYFVEAGTKSMWYSEVGAVTGALTEFDFSLVAGIEGALLYTTHLKGDGGDGGADDVFIAMFTGGDALAYSGSDPGDPTDWSLIGKFKVGRPLGRLAYIAAEDDIYAITSRGYEQLAKMVAYGDSYAESTLLSNKIQLEVSNRVSELGYDEGWRIGRYPKGQMLMFSIPRIGNARSAHVQNMNTKAWALFKGLMQFSFVEFQGEFYIGDGSGNIHHFDDGSTTDNGTAIRAVGQPAWTSFGSPGVNKHMHLIKPFLFSQISPSVSINLGANYNTIEVASFSGSSTTSAATWDTAIWDSAIWAGKLETFANWYSKNAVGEAIGMVLAVETDTSPVRWNQTTFEFTIGGYL